MIDLKAFIKMVFPDHKLTKTQERIIEHYSKPVCFGYYPVRFPHIEAERECNTCSYAERCKDARKTD